MKQYITVIKFFDKCKFIMNERFYGVKKSYLLTVALSYLSTDA